MASMAAPSVILPATSTVVLPDERRSSRGYITVMTLYDRISARLKATGKSAAAASREAGLSEDAIRNLKRNPGAGMQGKNIDKLAAVLGTTVDWLQKGEGEMVQPRQPGAADLDAVEPRAAFSTSEFRSLSQDLPVLGTAAGSLVSDGDGDGFELEARVIEYIRRPPGLIAVPDAYAIYVTGNSMSPQHSEGEIRLVHPGKPSRIGDSVVVQTKSGDHAPTVGYIGNLVRRSASKIVVAKLNPACEVEFEAKYVKSIHRILTVNELLGL